MNKVGKGNRVELLARKKLEAEGYLVERKNRTRFLSPDFWGVFDLIAIKGSTTRLIQVKSNARGLYRARPEITMWKHTHQVELPCELWLWLERSEFRIEVIV